MGNCKPSKQEVGSDVLRAHNAWWIAYAAWDTTAALSLVSVSKFHEFSAHGGVYSSFDELRRFWSTCAEQLRVLELPERREMRMEISSDSAYITHDCRVLAEEISTGVAMESNIHVTEIWVLDRLSEEWKLAHMHASNIPQSNQL